MKANAKYKDSVFTLLFGKPEILRELYGALEGVGPIRLWRIGFEVLGKAQNFRLRD